jgi:hypothetical protein
MMDDGDPTATTSSALVCMTAHWLSMTCTTGGASLSYSLSIILLPPLLPFLVPLTLIAHCCSAVLSNTHHTATNYHHFTPSLVTMLSITSTSVILRQQVIGGVHCSGFFILGLPLDKIDCQSPVAVS